MSLNTLGYSCTCVAGEEGSEWWTRLVSCAGRLVVLHSHRLLRCRSLPHDPGLFWSHRHHLVLWWVREQQLVGDFSGHSRISGFRFLSESDRNVNCYALSMWFSPVRIQTVILSCCVHRKWERERVSKDWSQQDCKPHVYPNDLSITQAVIS